MLVGIDVYHSKMTFEQDNNIYKQRRSLGAFVSILISDKGAYKTFCAIHPVQARKEILCRNDSETESVQSGQSGTSEVPTTVLEGPDITKDNHLRDFIKKSIIQNQITPDVVIIYRDGVGDGMLQLVRDHELSQVKEACPSSEVIFTIVQKNIMAKYFINNENGEWGNPPPGTVITTFQTTKFEDFYMISNKTNLSTAKPVRYILLEYNSSLPKNEFHSFTFTMCHLYQNWPDAVKVPFPVQLAHKLAYLVGETKSKEPVIHEVLSTKYFYL